MMTTSNILLLIFGIGIIPAIIAYDRFSRWMIHRNKKRKIAEFIEKSADKIIQAKDGPE